MKSSAFISRLLLIAFIVLKITPAFASVSLIQTGGIDVTLPDGSHIPIETYLERNSKPVHSVCDLVEVDGSSGESKAWRKTLNDVVSTIFNASPALAHTMVEAFSKSNFFFLNLPDGAKIFFTDDDGHLIETNKENGAVRMGNDVYLLTTAWRNYWANRLVDSPYQTMLTRITHEALIPYYQQSDEGNKNTYSLGKLVVEILRLANVYDPKSGHPSYSLVGKSAKEIYEAINQDRQLRWSHLGYGRYDFHLYNWSENLFNDSLYRHYMDNPVEEQRELGIKNTPIDGAKMQKWESLVKGAEQFSGLIEKEIKSGNLVVSSKKKWKESDNFYFQIYTANDLKQVPQALLNKTAYFINEDFHGDGKPAVQRISQYSFNAKDWQELNEVFLKKPVMCK